MEIKYLTKLKETPRIGSWEIEGISEEKIIDLENQLKIKLPLAFKEYLFLAGEFENILTGWDRGFDNLDYYQEEVLASMQNVNLHLKPFFVFATYGNDQALFFFLDEGDNPPVYAYDEMKIHKDEQGNKVFYKKTKNSFVELIEKHIEQVLKQ